MLRTILRRPLPLSTFLFLSAAGLAAGCGDRAPSSATGQSAQALRWSNRDAPWRFGDELEYHFEALPTEGRAASTPWPSSYWPSHRDSINYRWDPAAPPASEKYGQAFGVTGVADAVSRFRGVDSHPNAAACEDDSDCNAENSEVCGIREGATLGRCMPSWAGICHAWAPAAILVPEPQHAVKVGDVSFEVNDIKALVTLVHDDVGTRFASLRCNASDSRDQIEYDQYGRPTSSACQDTNPGTWHLLMTNYLGLKQQSFVFDRMWDVQVWNQPLRAFRVTAKQDVSAAQANQLIGASGRSYRFDPDAVRFVEVRAEIDYVTEADFTAWGGEAASSRPLLGEIDWYTNTDRYHYVLELDAQGQVIGGEWLDRNKRFHPDFVWLPTRVWDMTVADGTINYERVMKLVEESVR